VVALDQTWWVFFVPAAILAGFALLDIFILHDRPSQAGFADLDTGDAGSAEPDKPFKAAEIIKRVLTNPILLTIAFIELCSGVLRNGIMHWYLIFSAEMGYPKSFFITENWGLLLMIAGISGGILAGFVSDKIFGSRRGPVAALLYGLLLLSAIAIWPFVVSTRQQAQNSLLLQVDPAQMSSRFAEYQITPELLRSKAGDCFHIETQDSSASRIIWRVTARDKEPLSTSKLNDLVLAKRELGDEKKARTLLVKNVAQVIGAPAGHKAYGLGALVVLMSLCVIGVHGMLSGTSTMDFGGRRAAATAVGLIDGFVYLGTGIQSLALGFLTTKSWNYWPPFLIPFAVIGLILAVKIWHAYPDNKRTSH
jgi:sugar phosphate permease